MFLIDFAKNSLTSMLGYTAMQMRIKANHDKGLKRNTCMTTGINSQFQINGVTQALSIMKIILKSLNFKHLCYCTGWKHVCC